MESDAKFLRIISGAIPALTREVSKSLTFSGNSSATPEGQLLLANLSRSIFDQRVMSIQSTQ